MNEVCDIIAEAIGDVENNLVTNYRTRLTNEAYRQIYQKLSELQTLLAKIPYIPDGETDERDRDPDVDPPEPFLTWEEWQRTADSEERDEMRKYVKSMYE